MAIQWADDFTRYGTGSVSRSNMLDGLPYAVLGDDGVGTRNVVNDPDGEGGLAYRIGQNGPLWESDFRTALPSPVSGTVGTCFRAWFSSLPALSQNRPVFVGYQLVSGAYLVYARLEQNGSIQIFRRTSAASSTMVLATDSVTPLVSPSSWNHFEFIHNVATGEGSLYINGIERVTWTGVPIDAGNIALVNFSCRSAFNGDSTMYVKDYVIWDGTGSVNNSVMGTVLVGRLSPNADIALGDWTPSTGVTGWDLLAKTTPDDSTYLSAADTPMPSADMRFEMSDLPPDVTSIRGLISVTRHRKVDGGDGNLQTALSPNGTDWDSGADRPITTSFQYDFDVSELSPATSAAWTPIEVDDLELRVDRTV